MTHYQIKQNVVTINLCISWLEIPYPTTGGDYYFGGNRATPQQTHVGGSVFSQRRGFQANPRTHILSLTANNYISLTSSLSPASEVLLKLFALTLQNARAREDPIAHNSFLEQCFGGKNREEITAPPSLPSVSHSPFLSSLIFA